MTISLRRQSRARVKRRLGERTAVAWKQKAAVAHSRPLSFYGRNADFLQITSDKILSGPADTGKTIAGLWQANDWAWKYPGAQGAIVRKTYASMSSTVMLSFFKKILPYPPDDPRCPIQAYGGEKRPEIIIYPNGSRIYIGGMDNPNKILSSERDFIYVNQAEELVAGEWETLTTRTSGRAGNMPFSLTFGDANPGNQYHYILEKEREGTLINIASRHQDNPEIYDQATGELTDNGRQRIATLDRLTGLRYKRLRLGLWVAAEGQVYEFDPDIHLINANQLLPFVRRYRVFDFGYTNPFNCQWWGEDNDGRVYLYREIYMTGRTVAQHLPQINRLSQGESYAANIADHDAEDRATLAEGIRDPRTGKLLEPGISTIPADKRILVGIEKVQERLRVQGDGKPRLYIVRDCLVECDQTLKEAYRPTCTEQEFPGYVYPQTKEGKTADEKPVKVDDHGMDDTRYMVMHLDSAPPQPAADNIEVSEDVYKPSRERR
jgi:phage terminase large subunit